MSAAPADQQSVRFQRAALVAILGTFLAVLGHAGYLVFAFFMAFASVPAVCGFEGSENCTNTNTNAHQGVLAVVLVIAYLVLLAGLTFLIRRLIGDLLGSAAMALSTWLVVALSIALGIVPGLALLALILAALHATGPPSRTDVTLTLIGCIGLVGVWTFVLWATANRSDTAGG